MNQVPRKTPCTQTFAAPAPRAGERFDQVLGFALWGLFLAVLLVLGSPELI